MCAASIRTGRLLFQEEFNVKMFVGQDTVELDGIEHKPLRLTGDPENVEV